VVRLGDGTEESNSRIKKALEEQWMYTGELFQPAKFELEQNGNFIDPSRLQDEWLQKIKSVFAEAGLEIPNQKWMQSGGKEGKHTEHLGYLLAEMQHLQRTFPNLTW
jgi:ring-1,2-phenylacetyl-CoA epoxidase subunit PaaC